MSFESPVYSKNSSTTAGVEKCLYLPSDVILMSEISAGVPMNEPTAPAVIPEENKYLDFKTNYSQSLLYGHPLNMNTSLLWRVCFVPGERRPFTFNTDTFYGPLSVGINGV